MGDVTYLPRRGSALETLHEAAQNCADDDDLKAIVVMFGDDPSELYVSYSEEVDAVSAYYVLSMAAQWQMADEE